ncbi:MAG: hypothetical protein WD971_04690 [Pirellulales bacterium]
MRVERSLVALLVSAAITAAGCHNNLFQGPDPSGCEQGRLAYNLPPAERLMEPGPGVGGPGPGVIPPPGGMGMGGMGMGGMMADGAVMQAGFNAGGGCMPGCGGGGMMMAGGGTSQVAFLGEDGIQISWDVSGPGMFDSTPLVTPGRQDFLQGSIYRLRLSGIPGREAVELFPTLEVAPVTPRTDAFLAHAPIPVQFTTEDFDQVTSGNFVTKVIYLPDPEFQELTLTGVETLVSTRLDPGVDPIAEADRRGSILAIVRVGNKDFRANAGSYNYGPFGPSGPGGVMCANYQDEGAAPEMSPQPYESYDGGQDVPTNGQPSYPMDGGYQGGDCNCPGGCSNGQCYGGGYGGGCGYGGGQMPMGMPTAGFAPAAMPPNMIGGGPNWGMPITGTPIGLPGPPHIPLGSPAGLQRHVMKNRTRIHMPPPVTQMTMSVKQRPGINYPRPVNHVTVDEVHREPGGLFPGISALFHKNAGAGTGGGPPPGYDPYCQ